MAYFAKKKLLTSKGVIKSGEALPDNLPKVEVETIRKAGGLEEKSRGSDGAKSVALKDLGSVAEAEKAVLDAAAELSALAADDTRKPDAEKKLETARAELAKLQA